MELPRDQLTVVTGLSGSGKSSLAFDTIYGTTCTAYADPTQGPTRHPKVRDGSMIRHQRYVISSGARQAGQGKRGKEGMQTTKIIYWEHDGKWLGYVQDYPDYWTQGESLEDLRDHLRDLYADLSSGVLVGVRKVDDLAVV